MKSGFSESTIVDLAESSCYPSLMKDYKAESRMYFDELASRYESHYYGKHGRQQYKRVVGAARGWKFNSVLDIGCGTGALLALLKRPRVRLAGADISPKMIAAAEKRLGKIADLRVADSEKLPWRAGSFGLVVTTDSLHHWPRPLQAFAEKEGRTRRRCGRYCTPRAQAPEQLGRSVWQGRGRRSVLGDRAGADAEGSRVRRYQARTPQFHGGRREREGR